MTMANGVRTYQFKALTDLWTGSVKLKEKNGQIKEKTGPNRLITTGLLGSIRWWFEVLVRGLGGNACDPSPEDRKMNPPECRCPNKKVEKANDPGHHCVVCELFGCTGWARKFRFEVLDKNGNTKKDQIKRNQDFKLRFTPLRPIRVEEWTLLDATLRLIADYGAIGGKTVFKPTDESRRAGKLHHKDFGIVKIEKVDPPIAVPNLTEVKKFICEERWRNPESKTKDVDFSWTSLKYFWFVAGKTLTRENTSASSFNRVIGRPEPKQQSGQNDSWIAGRRPNRRNNFEAESKKVFSFKNPARTFGFVKPGLIDFNAMKQRLTNAWGQNGWVFLTGDKIIDKLFDGKEGRL